MVSDNVFFTHTPDSPKPCNSNTLQEMQEIM